MSTETAEATPDVPVVHKPLPGQRPLFDLEPTLFGPMEKERKERPREKRATAAKSGTGPEGETCGTCRHRVKPNGVNQKCGLVRHLWTFGAATDIKARWAACSQWEEVEGGQTDETHPIGKDAA